MSNDVVRVGISMPKNLRDDIKILAKSKGLDMSSFIRTLLIQELEKTPKK